MNYYNLSVILLMIMTFVSILIGLYLFAFKSELHKKHGNKLMAARIGFQALAVIMLMLVYSLKK